MRRNWKKWKCWFTFFLPSSALQFRNRIAMRKKYSTNRRRFCSIFSKKFHSFRDSFTFFPLLIVNSVAKLLEIIEHSDWFSQSFPEQTVTFSNYLFSCSASEKDSLLPLWKRQTCNERKFILFSLSMRKRIAFQFQQSNYVTCSNFLSHAFRGLRLSEFPSCQNQFPARILRTNFEMVAGG